MDKRQRSVPNPYWRLLIDYLGPQKGMVALLALLVLLSIGLQLANPQIVRYFLDSLQSGGTLTRLLGAATLFLAATIIQQLIVLGATYVGELVGWTATNWLRADLARHCLGLDMSFHKSHTAGELIERVDGDVNQMANFFSRMILTLGGNLLLLIGVIVLLWIEGWQFGLAITLVAVFSTWIVSLLRRHVTPRWQSLRAVDAELFGYLEERLTGMEDIQSSGAGAFVLLGLYRLLRRRWRAVLHAVHIDAWFVSMPVWIFGLSYAVAHVVTGAAFLRGELTVGTVYLVFYYVSIIEGPLWQAMDVVNQLQQAVAAVNRTTQLLQVQSAIHDGPGIDLPTAPLGVRFERVSFQYSDSLGVVKSGADLDVVEPASGVDMGAATAREESRSVAEVVIRDVSFELHPGTILGLLGRTGSGKSTLSKLLFRFYLPTKGHILIGDGVTMEDLQSARRSDLAGHIAMVTQNVQLFHASVRDNLTLFDDSIPDPHILHVLREVGLDEWLETLPAGLESELSGEDGNLSAGEAQLLAFSRVFLANPGLVILDEASSRLDPATEERIEQALDRLLQNRTAIIIAHRLTTVQRADEIMVLDNGSILEHGKRVQLATDPSSHFHRLLRTGLQEAAP